MTNSHIRILLVAYLYYPSTAVGARRIFNIKKFSDKNNINVNILTVKSSRYSEIDQMLGDGDEKNVERTYSIGPLLFRQRRPGEGIWKTSVRRVKYAINEILKNILFPDEYIGWAPFAILRGLKLHKRKQYDFIMATGSPWSNFLIGYIVSKKCNVPLIIDYRDPWIVALEKDKLNLHDKINRKIEKIIVRHSKYVFLNTQSILKAFSRFFPDEQKEKFILLRNGYDPDMHYHLKNVDVSSLRPSLNKFRIVHTGLFYGSRKIGNLIKAINELRKEEIINANNFEVIFYGTFIRNDRILIKELGLEKIIREELFLSYVDSLLQLKASTMNMLVVGNDHAARIPAKMYDYLMVERPIFYVGPNIGEAKLLIENNSFGICADINSPLDIKNKLSKIIMSFREEGEQLPLSAPLEYDILKQIKKIFDRIFT